MKTLRFVIMFIIGLCMLGYPVQSQSSVSILTMAYNRTDIVSDVEWNNTGDTLALATSDGIEIQNTSGVHILNIDISGGAFDVEWSYDDTKLAVIEWSGRISFWDVNNGQSLGLLDNFTNMLSAIEWNSNATQLFVLGFENQYSLWNMDWVNYNHSLSFIETYPGAGRDIELNNDNTQLAIALNGAIYIIDLTVTPIQTSTILTDDLSDEFLSVSWDQTGSLLATSGFFAPVRIWDVPTGSLLTTLGQGFGGGVVTWLNDDKIASLGTDNHIRIWNASSGLLLYMSDPITGATAWHPTGTQFAVFSESGNINLITPIVSTMVTSLTLVNTDTDTDIRTLNSTDTVDIANNGISIRANTNPATVRSVVFTVDGETIAIDNDAPYILDVDLLPLDTVTLVITPYTEANGNGDTGISQILTLIIVDSQP